MSRLLLVLCITFLIVGCRKPDAQTKTPPPAPGTPSGVTLNPAASGGSGGAAQQVRQAVRRTVSLNELNNIRTFIEAASAATGQMPSSQELMQSLQREAPATYKLIQDKSIALTGARSREGIWAYTVDPQSAAGEHLVVTASEVKRMPAQELAQALRQQMGQ